MQLSAHSLIFCLHDRYMVGISHATNYIVVNMDKSVNLGVTFDKLHFTEHLKFFIQGLTHYVGLAILELTL